MPSHARSVLLLVAVAITLVALLPALTPSFAEEDLPDFDRMWDYDKPTETEARFRALLPQAKASGNEEVHLQLLTQIARALSLQGKVEEAHLLLDEVEGALVPATPVAKVRYLLERGRTLNTSGHAKKAKPLFIEAFGAAKKGKKVLLAIDAVHMIAIVVPPEEQVRWHEKALALIEASDDPRVRGWLGPLYNNLGWTYFDLKDYEKALAIHRKGWAFRKQAGPETKPTRIAKWAVARMLRALERHDEALAMQRELLEAWSTAGEENGFVYEELGELLLILGHPEEATSFFVKAWAQLEQVDWLKKSEPDRYARLRRLADPKPKAETAPAAE